MVADAVHADQARVLQNLQVVGDGRPGQVGPGRDLRDAHADLLVFQQGNHDLLSRLVAQGEKDLAVILKFLRQQPPLRRALIHLRQLPCIGPSV
jgi:hypothetical protein